MASIGSTFAALPTPTASPTNTVAPTSTASPTNTASPTTDPPTITPAATAPVVTPTTAPAELPPQAATLPPTSTPGTLVVQPTPTLPVLDQVQRTALFDKVAGIIEAHYLYEDYGGVDWEQLKQEYQPRAMSAATSAGFYTSLKAMVAQLGDQHSRFLDPQAAYQEQGLSAGEVYVGVGVATIDDPSGRLVTTVYPNSPASEAGIKRRDIIVAVDGQPIDAQGQQISGPPGTSVRLQVRSPNGGQRVVTLERRPVLEQYVPEVYLLPGTDVGYVLIQSFWPTDTPQAVEQALQQFVAAEQNRLGGLIIDVRSNRGGWRTVLEGLLAHFVEGEVGAFYSQSATYPLNVTPTALYPLLQDLPLVVLVDRGTKSYAEVFAAVLQAKRDAQVVGVNTAGNTETIYAYNFDDGSRLWVAQEGFRLQDGANLEGRGVVPDRSIPVDWLQFSEVRDPHIVKGIELIRQQASAN
ncbi:MAG: S41 family peptidase [Chloroflexota bacterium]|nr:S41 family peptidase [Chloroflexota bacterium]